jgi:hypothetical protein
VALGVLWRSPKFEGQEASGRPLSAKAQEILLSPWLALAAQLVSVGLFVLVLVACFFGDQGPFANIAPTFIWVVFWLGLVPVVVIFGDVWRVLSPWRALADAAARVSRGTGLHWRVFEYPERAGIWPAAVLLFFFTALELAYVNPSSPKVLGAAALFYSAVTWLGMLVFGREQWAGRGEAFAVYFGFLSRLAPFALRARGNGESEIVVRKPLVGLADRIVLPGTLAFVAVMLGSVSFDGLSRSSRWQNWYYEAVLSQASPEAGDRLGILLNFTGLLVCVVAVAFAYLSAIALARLLIGSGRPLAPLFVYSLVPIALAYAIAHYFSLAYYQGQWAVRLASDPLGVGWDLFGSADFAMRTYTLSPNTIWYVQVASLVIGHVIALVLAHDRAVATFQTVYSAVLAQFALLALMVLYTVGGLWLLSQG